MMNDVDGVMTKAGDLTVRKLWMYKMSKVCWMKLIRSFPKASKTILVKYQKAIRIMRRWIYKSDGDNTVQSWYNDPMKKGN